MPDRKPSAVILALTLCTALPSVAGPAIDERGQERLLKLDVRPRRAPPAVVPAACPVPAEEQVGVTAAALAAELKKNNARRAELLAAEASLEEERATLAAEKERLAAERLDLDLTRAELEGGPRGVTAPSAAAPKDATPSAGDDDVKSLSATVKAMKADRAAAVVALLDRALAAKVMRTLSKPAAAAIYDRLTAEKAVAIMQAIAQSSETGGTP